MACERCAEASWEHTWRPATNEDGWECGWCGAKLGFRPDLDDELLEIKVRCLLYDFEEADLVYVSNGTMGDAIVAGVEAAARKRHRFDQHTILRLILEDPNLSGHADYWAKERRRVLDGEPDRVDRHLREIGAALLPGLEGV